MQMPAVLFALLQKPNLAGTFKGKGNDKRSGIESYKKIFLLQFGTSTFYHQQSAKRQKNRYTTGQADQRSER